MKNVHGIFVQTVQRDKRGLKYKMACRRCKKEIPDEEYNNAVGTGFCYGCWIDHITECQKIVEV